MNHQFWCDKHNYGWSVDEADHDAGCPTCQERCVECWADFDETHESRCTMEASSRAMLNRMFHGPLPSKSVSRAMPMPKYTPTAAEIERLLNDLKDGHKRWADFGGGEDAAV